tara:strand:+ start:47 stop:637 length:591 start_codon:yes stop_codon:yes gene_type:complete
MQKKSKLNLKVRILSGSWRGKNVTFLDKEDLRPTKNIIRETLFNWIQEDVKDSICLDLFAGSGVLGFEAASRGARKVYMIDIDTDITNHLSTQKKELNANNVYISNSSAFSFLKNLKENFNVIFLDPPFSKEIINEIIRKLSLMKEISDKCKIYIELPYKKNNEFMLETPDNWNLLKSKKTGEVVYLLFQHNAFVI